MGKGSAAREVTSLGLVCAGLVEEVEVRARKGDALATGQEEVTVFDADKGAAPTVGLKEYVERWITYSGCSKMSVVMASAYIERSGIQLTSFNMHRTLLASLLVAAKFHDDVFYSNTFYSAVGGSTLAEVNRLERAILQACEWSMLVSKEEYETRLAALMRSHTVASAPMISPKHPEKFEKLTPVTIAPPSCVDRFFGLFGL
eukprot:TRINITY_DN3495_c3_g1_i1.p1 TRINITY_DN3495_c3_g1~~TRINITY_DN3495_c3_g1_i1.p1  ORF type:complete len:224 (+),score=42.86 TRINITY_DN3495_c3_g1_i1:68-673(+)